MGIELTYVLPVKDHLSVFNCALCSNLVSLDGYVAISCGHCFCQGCFRTWTETQDSQSWAHGCPECGVNIASRESYGIVDWKVQTLSKGHPLIHRMLSQIKVLCPCRFSARMCYWTGDYSDLKQHITTSHPQPTANEQTHKSCMSPESASKHQEPTSGSQEEEGLQSERAKQRSSDHVRTSSSNEQQVQAMEERAYATSHRMPQRRSMSIPGSPNKYSECNPNVLNNVSASQNGRHSNRGLMTEDISWSRGEGVLNRETSMGVRLNEINLERSFPKHEYWRQKPPSTSIPRSTPPTSTSPDAALNMDAWRHQSDAALGASHDTFKSTKSNQGQAIENSDNTLSHRMTRRRTLSISDASSKSKPSASNTMKVSRRRLRSRDWLSVDGTNWESWKSDSTGEASMGNRSAESNTSRSLHKSEESQIQRPPSTSIPRCRFPSSLQAAIISSAPRDADLYTGVRLHHSGTSLDASNDASKSNTKRPTIETSEPLTSIKWPRRKVLVETRTSTSMPTALALEVSASWSEVKARLLERQQGDGKYGTSTPSSRRDERKKQSVGSLNPVRRNRLDSISTGSISSSSLSTKGPRNHQLTKLERQATFAYKKGNYTIAYDLYTTAIDAFVSSDGSPTDGATYLARLYGNRAAVSLQQSMFKACVKDCDAALSLNKRLIRACLRKARALNEMGLFAEACAAVSSGLKDNPGVFELEKELANCRMLRMKFALVQSFLDVKKYEEARTLLLETQSSLRHAVILQCEAELGLGNADVVLEALNPDILQNDFMGGHVIELIAEAHFQNGHTDKAIKG
ncbi:hypothetical protein MHU86_10593 [Fragilaria crotonensis]|nr:hypothetical protein MHU86_10593 [Fragilaria crotonensis]